ncbi:AAA family ATPase [Pseudovibrio sp. POLY-S9]|uniref:ATP-binding protein n=1 Tax=Pseudovibrio sp. POLY-S9 TaxID=1576596 RepID=UPI000710ADA6|nr:AAA family ATPase [Pseudovibrio sp. POLY-S9]
MKIAIAGKGGVGKTTLTSLLARSFAKEGMRVLAIDADPDANLAGALGVSSENREKLVPLANMKDLAIERTGHGSGFGGFFVLNPTVDDLPETLSIKHEGIRILSLGSIRHGGSGCVCSQHTIVRALMNHILLKENDLVLMDMEAGIEHLGRGTAEAVDLLIVVVEPGRRSLETAAQIERLAKDLGIENLAYVGSKLRDSSDMDFLSSALPNERFLGGIQLSDAIRTADLNDLSPFDQDDAPLSQIKDIQTRIRALGATTNVKANTHVPDEN